MVPLCAISALVAQAQQPEVRTVFRVKYVAEGAVYLDGGRNAGLAEGQKLDVKRSGTTTLESRTGDVKATRIFAQLEVTSVAESSAVCEVRSSTEQVRTGDMAYLSPEDVEKLAQLRAASGVRRYPQVVTFSEGDPLDEEAREAVPRPPLPEINRARGRIGFEYNGIASRSGFSSRSTQLGLVLRLDMTRLGGSYWNLSGYWRGRLNSRSGGTQPETLNDLINRTYHLNLTYSNPASRWVAGFGRLYLPWASSLNTLDGGYLGRRFGKGTTVGLFAGSTPDPTSWNYNPDRRIAGTFANFEGGGFDSFRYTSTVGVAVSSIRWRAERQFAFFENGIFYRRHFTLYHSLEADRAKGINQASQSLPRRAVVSRSYLTLMVQPHPRLSLSLNHNYFRDLPTFDSRLVSTGLVDKLLFQGLSGGARLELPRRITLFTSLGRSAKTGDTRNSWNQMYGITLGEIWRTGLRADLRYSKFESSFGRGSYRSLSLSRHFGENFRWEVQGGLQNFASPLTQETRSHFVNTILDWFPGTHYFFESGVTFERGHLQDYDQWFVILGYRF